MRKAIFLDRDGVLNSVIIKNGKPYPPPSVQELSIPSEVEDALISLKKAGFLLIGATNQPDVARGTTSKETIEAINSVLMDRLPLDEIRVCYHDDRDHCECRKPLPGLLKQAAIDYGIALNQSFMIGDRWKDIDAGRDAGCKTIWINRGYAEKKPINPDFVATTLAEAAAWIIKFNNGELQ